MSDTSDEDLSDVERELALIEETQEEEKHKKEQDKQKKTVEKDEVDYLGKRLTTKDDKLKYRIFGRFNRRKSWVHRWNRRRPQIDAWLKACRRYEIHVDKATPREKEHLELCASCRHWLIAYMLWFKYQEEEREDYLWATWETFSEKSRIDTGKLCAKKELRMLTHYLKPVKVSPYSMYLRHNPGRHNKWRTLTSAEQKEWAVKAEDFKKAKAKEINSYHPVLKRRVVEETARRKRIHKAIMPRQPPHAKALFTTEYFRKSQYTSYSEFMKVAPSIWAKQTDEEKKHYEDKAKNKLEEYRERKASVIKFMQEKYPRSRLTNRCRWYELWFDPIMVDGHDGILGNRETVSNFVQSINKDVANRKAMIESAMTITNSRANVDHLQESLKRKQSPLRTLVEEDPHVRAVMQSTAHIDDELLSFKKQKK